MADPYPLPTYQEFYASFANRFADAAHPLIRLVPTGELKYESAATEERPAASLVYPMFMLESRNGHEDVAVIRATIHGDEVAGALTLHQHVEQIFQWAEQRRIHLVVFPLDNPSGFEHRLRYNIEGHCGEGNNDFLRYQLEDGSWAGDLPDETLLSR